MSRPWQIYVDGQWQDALGGRRFPVFNPATGEVVGEAPDAGAAETAAAVDAAHRAFRDWSRRTPYQRAELMLRAARLLQERAPAIARVLTLEMGKPLSQSEGELAWSVAYLTYYAEEAKRVFGQLVPSPSPDRRHVVIRQPVGPVAAITPWNAPLNGILRKLAPALAAGCTVVVKPAEQTPLSPLMLFQVLHDAGFPPGVVNIVTAADPRPVGETLLRDPRIRKISFTGSTEVGKLLLRGAADTVKRVSMELGGHAPFIVFADADLQRALEALMVAKFRMNGQVCLAPNRIYVHVDVMEAFGQMLAERVRRMVVGNPLDEGVECGPLVDEQGLAKVMAHVEDAVARGARLLCGGGRLAGGLYDRGHFYAPTVLAGVTPAMRIYHEETFGPVAPLVPFQSDDEVVAMANDSPYGLAAYLFTRDMRRAWEVAEALDYGLVGVNDGMPATPYTPLGGRKESGMGREGGVQGIWDYLDDKLVTFLL